MKKIISKKFFAIGALLFLVNAGFAQTLPELIQVALANNYQIQILKNQQEMAANSNTIGNSGQLPSVGLTGGISTASNNIRQELANGSVNEGNNAQTSNMNFSLLANWRVFDGFGVYARKDQLEYLEQMGELNAKFYIEQTVADIAVAYYQLVYEKQVLENHKMSLLISSYRLRLEEKRKSVGSGTLLDYGQAQVDYYTDSIARMTQETKIRSLEIELNRILNQDLELNLNVDESTFSFEPVLAKDTLLAQTQRNNIQLERFMLAELMAETALRMEKANRYPLINLYGGFQFTQSQAEIGFILQNRNAGPVVGLNVNFNLFNGGQTNIAVKNAELELENTSLNTQLTNVNLDAQLLDLYNQYNSLSDRIALARLNVETMQKVYQVASEQFSKGGINGYEFRLTQLSLLNAQITLTAQQFSLKLVEINLNRIAGTVVDSYL